MRLYNAHHTCLDMKFVNTTHHAKCLTELSKPISTRTNHKLTFYRKRLGNLLNEWVCIREVRFGLLLFGTGCSALIGKTHWSVAVSLHGFVRECNFAVTSYARSKSVFMTSFISGNESARAKIFIEQAAPGSASTLAASAYNRLRQ